MEKGKEAVVDELPLCDLCKMEGSETIAKYDGKTRQGPWGYMCEMHFKTHGIGLGLGRGQKLVLEKREEEGKHIPDMTIQAVLNSPAVDKDKENKKSKKSKCDHETVLEIYKDDTHEEISYYRCVQCGEKENESFGKNVVKSSRKARKAAFWK